MEPIIKLEDFRRTYRNGSLEVQAVRGVSLEIHAGEFVAVMGASGSGKSTMMNTIGCLDRPTSGRYLLDGVDIGELNRDELADLRNRKLGFVFQGFNLLARTSALENVELPILIPPSRPRARTIPAGPWALKVVGEIRRPPSSQLRGQQQRSPLPRGEPAPGALDEPTGNLTAGPASK
jgi:putative ABC transport system ATP-binding protein